MSNEKSSGVVFFYTSMCNEKSSGELVGQNFMLRWNQGCPILLSWCYNPCLLPIYKCSQHWWRVIRTMYDGNPKLLVNLFSSIRHFSNNIEFVFAPFSGSPVLHWLVALRLKLILLPKNMKSLVHTLNLASSTTGTTFGTSTSIFKTYHPQLPKQCLVGVHSKGENPYCCTAMLHNWINVAGMTVDVTWQSLLCHFVIIGCYFVKCSPTIIDDWTFYLPSAIIL